MEKLKVYDLPTRLFHGVFAGLFVAAFLIVQNYDEHSAVFPYHMLLGFTLAFAVLLRILWGFVGTRYARFSGFRFNIFELFQYFVDLFTAKTRRTPGHNPASSWAAVLMMTMALGLAVTGYLMTQTEQESLKELHELLANGFVVLAGLHVVGIVLHTLRHRDEIGLSMLHGNKLNFDEKMGIAHGHALAGFVFLALVILFGGVLLKGYDSNMKALKVGSMHFSLGDSKSYQEHGYEMHNLKKPAESESD